MDSETVISSRISDTEPTNCATDPLEVLKQDPAILDAQIKIETSSKSRSSSEPDVSRNNQEKQKSASVEDFERKEIPDTQRFEEMIRMQKAALLSLAPDQLELLLSYAGVLRLQRHSQQKSRECVLCKKNGKPSAWYTTHVLKDNRGRVRCPVLRGYRCPVCGATGDRAHTIKYCPENQYGDRWSR